MKKLLRPLLILAGFGFGTIAAADPQEAIVDGKHVQPAPAPNESRALPEWTPPPTRGPDDPPEPSPATGSPAQKRSPPSATQPPATQPSAPPQPR